MFPGGGNGGKGRISQTPLGFGGNSGPFSAQHHHHQQQQQSVLLPPHPHINAVHQHHLYPPQTISSPVSIGSGGGSSSGGVGGGNEEEEFPRRDERFPQWGVQETREFTAIRAQLEAEFSATKGNKAFWEIVSAKMREKGYYRTPLQCCTKWENLITNFKEKEAIDQDYVSQSPFSRTQHEFVTTKEKEVLDAEAISPKGRKRSRVSSRRQSSEEFYADEEEKNESDDDKLGKGTLSQRKKVKKEKGQHTVAADNSPRQAGMSNNNSANVVTHIKEMLRDFFQQQQKIDMEWMESMDKRAQERKLFEQEWRQSMEKLERERLMMEQAWREKEEQRRTREESRAEKRDALLTVLLNKLIHD